jgi:hypothetical protein
MSLGNTPGSTGITVIIGACFAVSWVMTVVTGSFVHWPFVLAGIVVGLWAVASINK